MTKVLIQKRILLTLRTLCFIILAGIISDWFFDYNAAIKDLLFTAMFVIIGTYFLIAGIATQNKWLKAIIFFCSIYLITFSFFGKSIFVTLIGIACIITPFLIFKYAKDYSATEEE